jgi:hypothetical protein
MFRFTEIFILILKKEFRFQFESFTFDEIKILTKFHPNFVKISLSM